MLSSLLALGSRWTLVGGKGGVGKTTSAAALAVELADSGQRVLALSVDPAHSLGDALGVALGGEPVPIPGVPGLEAMEIDSAREQDRFLDTRRGSILRLVERGTYLQRTDVESFADLAVPGVDELAALFRLLELAGDTSRRLVIDTAPTGHTLRLLDLPRLARGWLAALEAMQEKHEAVSLALVGAYRSDAASALLKELDADLSRVEALLGDPPRTRFLLVTTPEPGVLAETRRYRAELEARGIGLAGILVNRSAAHADAASTGRGMAFVPPLEPDPTGPDGLRRFAAAAAAEPSPEVVRRRSSVLGPALSLQGSGPGPTADSRQPTALQPFLPPLDRRIYVVGGKGGVGKSTAAGALALWLAGESGRRVRLLSTDPAGSLGEVFGMPVGGDPAEVPGAHGLRVQQLDAPAVWDAFRAEFREETERLFSKLLSAGMSASADQRVVQRLIDLAPPGVDELVALLEVVDATEDQPYDALVLDTAPTGHLLRLLELPGVALEWTHALMRLLIKYRDAVPLGELAEQVLRLSRSLRTLRERLSDAEQTWFLAVALPEALSVPETGRLLGRLKGLGMEAGALLVNRLGRGEMEDDAGSAGHVRALAALDPRLPAVGAPRLEHGPVGPAELLRFIDGWRRLDA